jgi:hypothetical protein
VGSGQSGVPDLTVTLRHGRPGASFHRATGRGRDVRPGKSGVPGLISLSGPFTVRAQTPSSSSRCARWMSDGTAGPSRSKPSPTVLFCRNLAWMPSSTTASLKQPKAM